MTQISCRQLSPVLGDVPGNQQRILEAISSTEADILVLPELATSGYVFQTLDEVSACAVPADAPLFDEWAAALSGDSVVVAGFAERGADGLFYNSAAVVASSGVLATYRKAHLWDREKLFFTPGSELAPVVETQLGRIAVMICYDLEFPEFTRQAALAGADLIAVPTNWPLVERPAGERPPELMIGQGAARVNQVAIACCDRAGVERGQVWTEGTGIVSSEGWLVSSGPFASADLDLTASRDKKISDNNDVFLDRRTDLY